VRPIVTSDGVSRTVPYGTLVSTTFTVTANGLPFARRPVQVCVGAKNAKFLTCRAATTSATGTVLFRRSATASYRVMLNLPLTKTSEAAKSDTFTYTVQAIASMEKKNRTLYANVRGAAGQVVRLQRLDGGAWKTVATYRAVTRYTVKKPVAGAQYRILVPDTALMAGTVSAGLRY
jgi:hypothetical protein